MAGNKDSGRKGFGLEKNFWKTLDKALPSVVKFCKRLIDEAEKVKKKSLLERKPYDENALKASKILMDKAPQRIAGADGGNLEINVVQFSGDKK